MASGPAVGGNDGTRERQRFADSKVYTRKAFRGLKKNVANTTAGEKHTTTTVCTVKTTTTTTTTATENGNGRIDNFTTTAIEENKNNSDSNGDITATVSARNSITDNITATAKQVSDNLLLPEPRPREQDPGPEGVNLAIEAGQDLQDSAKDVNSVTESVQELQVQIQAAKDVNSVPEPEQELQLQSLSGEDVNSVTEPEQERQLQTLSAEDVNSVPEVQTLAAEDVDLVPESEQELQLQARAVGDVILAREPLPEQETQLHPRAVEDSSTESEPGTEQEPQFQAQAAEDVNVVQQQEQEQLVSQLVVVADDSSSLNQLQVLTPSAREPGNGSVKQGMEGRVKLSLGSGSGDMSRSGSKREMRRKLEIELDKVRKLVKRIEAKEGEIGSGFTHSHVSVNEVVYNGGNRVHSEMASAGVNRETTRPLNHLRVSGLDNGHGLMSDNLEKEKRTPKANSYYLNSEFLLAKDKFPPAESNKKAKLNGKKHGGSESRNGFRMGAKFFKSCSSLLDKLMKHKHGWVFNTPVDAEALGLHDYHVIIEHPMDLGTVKSRLTKNWYKSPKEFVDDVRLTFHNAMTYNPKGQDVHVMAEQLLKVFEDRWAIIESDYNREMRFHQDYEVSLATPTSRYAPLSLPLSQARPSPLDMRRIVDGSESLSHSFDPKLKPTSTTPSSRTPALKKPKAKDLNKRDMTYEEKQKLSTNLQSLPSEKLDFIVQIIKKRNSAVLQHDDEIEVDIDSVDAETLWELDRFVTNYKKGLSKYKRKAELAIQARLGAGQNVQEKNPPPVVAPSSKEIRTDARNVSASSPVQGVKVGDNVSGSSSSSSSSSDSGSSSSDSDSDTSSASGSDAEHSPKS